jgi:hypothetical protein
MKTRVSGLDAGEDTGQYLERKNGGGGGQAGR